MTFDRHAKLALVVVTLTLAACGVGFRLAVLDANAYLEKKPVPLRDQLSNIPKRLGRWHAVGEDSHLTAEIEEALGTAQYLDRYYELDRSERSAPMGLSVHIAYYTGLIDTLPHVPDRCLVVAGWAQAELPTNLDLNLDRTAWKLDEERVNLRTGEPYPLLTFRHHITGRPITVRMPLGESKLRLTEFRDKARPDRPVYAGYFFIANGEMTPKPEAVRLLAFYLSTKYAYYAKIQFTTLAPEGFQREQFLELVSDLAAELLPELMRCLPDWAEVESWTDVSPTESAK